MYHPENLFCQNVRRQHRGRNRDMAEKTNEPPQAKELEAATENPGMEGKNPSERGSLLWRVGRHYSSPRAEMRPFRLLCRRGNQRDPEAPEVTVSGKQRESPNRKHISESGAPFVQLRVVRGHRSFTPFAEGRMGTLTRHRNVRGHQDSCLKIQSTIA